MGNFFAKKKEHAPSLPNVVYLYQFPRWQFGPCQSMPCMRVEAFLRLHKIPHVVVPSMKAGPVGRWPWIKYNGKVAYDSQLIIDFLIKELNLKPAKALTAEQEGISITVERMLDFHVYPFVVRWSWVDNFEMVKRFGTLKLPFQFMTNLLLKYVRGGLITYLNTGGWGEYTDEQYRAQWVEDVTAIAQILGDKKYLFGDDEDSLCRLDISVFSYLQAPAALPEEYAFPGVRALVAKDTPLGKYLARIQARIYPDMAELCSRAGSNERQPYRVDLAGKGAAAN